MIGVKLVFVEIHEKRVENVVTGKGRFAKVATWSAGEGQEGDILYFVKEWKGLCKSISED